MKLGIAEIMKLASEQPTDKKRIETLRKHGSPALVEAFRLAYHPDVSWDLPREWKPEYEKNPYLDQEPTLYQSMRKMGKFLVDGYPGLTIEKKKLLFVQLLESVAPLDAELLVSMKARKIPWSKLGPKTVRLAFPGLLPEPKREEDDD